MWIIGRAVDTPANAVASGRAEVVERSFEDQLRDVGKIEDGGRI